MNQVENLFHNTPTRLSALRGSGEEYARILDIVTKYAIHNPHVSFSCRKVPYPGIRRIDFVENFLFSGLQTSSNTPDVTTPSGSNVTQAIRQLYGQTIAKDLLHTKISTSEDTSSSSEDGPTSWSAEAYFTNANYHAKKTVFLLFINRKLRKLRVERVS